MANFECLKAIDKNAQYWKRNSADRFERSSAKKHHSYRSVFAYDRDRVMYCTAFRRLASKTQVFNSRTSDHLRTRLTHTLEVAQIARTIASALRLDEDLTEAIALGHDVGHTPFGHVGERTLHAFSLSEDESQTADKTPDPHLPYSGFKHNLQSVRVLVESPEGLRFSNYMLFGIREHTDIGYKNKETKLVDSKKVQFYEIYDSCCSYRYSPNKNGNTAISIPAWSFEAYVVKWADHIAQRHHDFEDAFLQKIMSPADIVDALRPLHSLAEASGTEEKYKLISNRFKRLEDSANEIAVKGTSSARYSFIHTLSSFVVNAYVTFFIDEFSKALQCFQDNHSIHSRADFESRYVHIDVEEIRRRMKFVTEVKNPDGTDGIEKAAIIKKDDAVGKGIKNSILQSHNVQWMDGKGEYTIRKLVCAYLKNPQLLPDRYVKLFVQVELPRAVTTTISTNDKKKPILRALMAPKKIAEIVNPPELTQDLKYQAYLECLLKLKSYQCREILQSINEKETDFDIPDFQSKAYSALVRVVCDYIAGMTDSYASEQFASLYR